jgi:hypothetical protein
MEAAKILQKKKYETHEKIYTNGSKKDEVHQHSTVFSTEQEVIIKAIWLTAGTQRDKVIITDSLSTLTAIVSVTPNIQKR